MSNEDDSKPRSEGRYPLWAGLIAVVVLGGIATGGILYATQDHENPTFTPLPCQNLLQFQAHPPLAK